MEENYRVWISVDETMNATERNIVNLIVERMCKGELTILHLLACKQLEKANRATYFFK